MTKSTARKSVGFFNHKSNISSDQRAEKNIHARFSMAAILALLLFACTGIQAQTNVALAPVAKQQFLSSTGVPLANGCVFTYQAGTSTQQATYTDSTGTIQASNPIILDAGGFTSIWLSNLSYRIAVWSAGGVNCATGQQQYVIDNVSAYQIINQANDLFLFPATSDPGGVAGELAYRSDLGCVRFFTTLWDCLVGSATTQTLTNKTLTWG